MNILCGLDDAYTKHCAVMLTSLFRNTPGKGFRIYVVHEGLSELSRRLLGRICRRWGHELILVEAHPEMVAGLPLKMQHISIASYYRLLVAHLLPADLDRVLYLDSDLVVRSDIRPFYESDLADHYLAAAAELEVPGQKERLGMGPDERYFNSGVILMNLPIWRGEQVGEQALAFAVEKSHLMQAQDQDALNAICNGRVAICPPKWNAGMWVFNEQAPEIPGVTADQLQIAQTDPAIAHYTGSHKPWLGGKRHPFAQDYFEYLKRTPYFGPRHLTNRLRMKGQVALSKLGISSGRLQGQCTE